MSESAVAADLNKLLPPPGPNRQQRRRGAAKPETPYLRRLGFSRLFRHPEKVRSVILAVWTVTHSPFSNTAQQRLTGAAKPGGRGRGIPAGRAPPQNHRNTSSRSWQARPRARKRRNRMGETGFCKNMQVPAISCENLQLQLPNPFKCQESQQKSAEICDDTRSSPISPFSFLPYSLP